MENREALAENRKFQLTHTNRQQLGGREIPN
jgi:hypothetical protein